ncbi:MAG: response regulator [Anaerotruncus sp.]|nr:response regulator [Anaerotruncus sp.]
MAPRSRWRGPRTEARSPVVLVVDDDLSYLDKLQRALRDIYTVHTTTSGVEAIHLIKALPEVNVLVVNEDLPRMKGTELLRFLNEIFKNADAIIKILLTESALERDDDRPGQLRPHRLLPGQAGRPGRHPPQDQLPHRPALAREAVVHARHPRRVTRTSASRPARSGEAKLVNLSENGMFLKTLSSLPRGLGRDR